MLMEKYMRLKCLSGFTVQVLEKMHFLLILFRIVTYNAL